MPYRTMFLSDAITWWKLAVSSKLHDFTPCIHKNIPICHPQPLMSFKMGQINSGIIKRKLPKFNNERKALGD